MSSSDDIWQAYERVADALARDIFGADEAEVLADHAGRGARVRADALRQAVRRGLAGAPSADDGPRDLVRTLTMCPQREDEP